MPTECFITDCDNCGATKPCAYTEGEALCVGCLIAQLDHARLHLDAEQIGDTSAHADLVARLQAFSEANHDCPGGGCPVCG